MTEWLVYCTWTEQPILRDSNGANGPVRYPFPVTMALPPIVCGHPQAAELHAAELQARHPHATIEIHQR